MEMGITEKAAFLKGMLEGMQLDPAAKETKIFNAIADLLGDIGQRIEDLEDQADGLSEELDDLDDLLGSMAYDDEEDEEYMVTCPNCGESFLLDDDMLDDGGIICPHCSQRLEFDLGDLLDEDELPPLCSGCPRLTEDEDEE